MGRSFFLDEAFLPLAFLPFHSKPSLLRCCLHIEYKQNSFRQDKFIGASNCKAVGEENRHHTGDANNLLPFNGEQSALVQSALPCAPLSQPQKVGAAKALFAAAFSHVP